MTRDPVRVTSVATDRLAGNALLKAARELKKFVVLVIRSDRFIARGDHLHPSRLAASGQSFFHVIEW